MTTVSRLLAAVLVVATVGVVPSAHAASSKGLDVVGFQDSSGPRGRIDRSADALTSVGVDGINLTRDGKRLTTVGDDALGQRDRAHRDGLRADLLVGNYDGDLGDFSERVAHRMLSSAANRDTIATRLGHIARRQHWDGITVDIESLTARDRPGLSKFLRALDAALPSGRSLSIAVQNNTSIADYRANGYQLATIGRIVDVVELMAYDQHGPWEDTPGPIGGLSWQRQGLDVLLAKVPARKVDLGVAGYGYAWRPHSNDTLSDAGARRLAGSRATWNPHAGEWTATLADGSTLWWSDARSYALRVTIARHRHLNGLAVWSLGLSDRIR